MSAASPTPPAPRAAPARAAHSLEGSGSTRIQEIFAAITDAISQAGTGSSPTTP